MPKTRRWIVLLLVLAAGVALAVAYVRGRAPGRPGVLRVSGNIEVTDAEVSFKIAGRVQERLVSEGQTVRRDQVVARLESADLAQDVALRRAELRAAQAALAELEAGYRPEEIAQAEAAAAGAQARLDELTAGSRPQEVAASEATVASARVEAERLRTEYDRQAHLVQTSTVSRQEYDRAKSDYETARARLQEAEERLKLIREGPRKEQIEQARAALQEASARLSLLRKGPRAETIEQARARVEQACAALGLAETRLGYATLLSPLSGVVLSENVESGEYVAPGTPVVTVGDIEHVRLRAYVDETDLGRVKLGQSVRVTTDTYPGKGYTGRLSFISSEAEFTPKNVQTERERVKLVYRVKIDIPNPGMELKPGMPADAEVILGGGPP